MRHAVNREQLEFRRRGSGLGQRGEHRFTDAAFRPVIFYRDETSAGGFDLFGERFAVDRLDAVEIDHANRRALRFQLVGGFQCFVQRDAGADYRDFILRALSRDS